MWIMPVLFGFLLSAPLFGQIHDDPALAFNEAAASGKNILLIFSGSDWCAPCATLNEKVLSTGAFHDYASEHLILLRADFPQRNRLARALRDQYEALAEQYNPAGEFPRLVLLRPDRSLLATLPYTYQPVNEFIAMLQATLNHENTR